MIAKNDNNALMIPQDATVQVQDKIFVYKVDANGTIHYSEIKVDPQNDGVNYVVTSGLKIGERIVSKEIKPLTPAQYEEALKKAAQLGENQSSASGFLKAMKGNDDKK